MSKNTKNNMTPVLPFVQERLKAVRKEIDKDLFLWLSGKKYPGLKFDGSLILGYWGPYLDGHIHTIIDTAFSTNRELAFEHNLDPTTSVNDALVASEEAIKGLLDLMADYDQRMRGEGYPKRVARRDVLELYTRFSKLAHKRAENEINFFKLPKRNTIPLPLTAEYGFWWFIKNCHWSVYLWLIPILFSLLIGAFSLGLGAGRNDTFLKLYDILHSATNTQPTTIPPVPQKKNNTTK
jgi:hypothetical protein